MKNPLSMDKDFLCSTARIALPITLQSVITIGINMMDTIMLGRYGEVALSASSLANQFIHIFQIICMGLGMGASVMTARYWGKEDLLSFKKVVAIMYRLAGILVLGFTLATVLLPGRIMAMYSPDEAIITEGISYFLWSIPAYLLVAGSLTTTVVLRSAGQVKVPLVSSIISFFVNIFFNWVFIFGHLGAPRMGVAGAALGTTLARLVEFCIVFGYFVFTDTKVRFRLKDLFLPCRDLLSEYTRISLPVVISDGLMALGNSMVAMIMGHIGSSFVSANAITSITVQLSTIFIQGISSAGCIMTGYALGKGDVKGAQKQAYSYLALGAVLGLIGGVLIALIGDTVVSFYLVSEETQMIAKKLMLSVGLIVVFQSTNSVATKGVLRGGGDTRFLMVADVIFLWIASIPLGYLSGLVLHMDPFWIYFFLKIDNIFKVVVAIRRLRSGKWIKSIRSTQDTVGAKQEQTA